MAINITPNVSVDALRNLDADKTYFLSSTTGKIKEASCWMRFKCAIGVKSAREKVGNLVEAVRTALLQSAGLRKDGGLETDIRDMDTRFMISGSAIRNAFSHFSAVNSEAILRKEAEGLARMEAAIGFQFVNQRNYMCGPDRDIISVFQHAFKAVVNGDLPTKQDESGRTVLDKTAFTLSLRTVREEVKKLLLEICDDERLGHPSIDRHYARHIVTTMFREDGTRNENALSDLQTPDEAFAAYLYNLDSHNGTINTQIHRELEKRFPGFMPEFKEAMLALSGAAMPRGSITRLAEEAGRHDFSALAKLNSFSGPGTIIAAIDQLRVVEELHTMMQPHDRVVEELDTSDITWEQAMEDNDLDADEILNGHIEAALKENAA